MSPKSEAVAKACARVKERLESMTYESRRFALDAVGAKVVATPKRSTLHGYLPAGQPCSCQREASNAGYGARIDSASAPNYIGGIGYRSIDA